MKFCLLFALLITRPLWAQLVSEHELTREIEATSTEEARAALLHEAALQAVSKHAAELGFDHGDFSRKLAANFQSYFKEWKESKLRERFPEAETLGPEQVEFLEKLEAERTREFRKFTKLREIIQSFTFLTVGTKPGQPKHWTGTVKLQLDKVKLERLLRLTITGESKQFSKIWVVTEVTSLHTGQTALADELSMRTSLSNSWAKYLNENLPKNVEEAAACDDACLAFFQQWETLPQGRAPELIDPKFQNGIWLKVSLGLRRSGELLEWEGRVLVLDVNTKRILGSYRLDLEKRNLTGKDPEALFATIGAYLYRSPLPVYKQLENKLPQIPALNRVSRLTIKGQRHLGDVMEIVDLLKNKGASLALDVKLSSFQQQEAQVLCFYQGEEKSFTDLLSRLKELKSSQSYQLVNEHTGMSHVLRLVTE